MSGWRVTERDLSWLAWIGRWRAVTAQSLSEEFAARGESAPLKKVETRLRAMRSLGLVDASRVLADRPRLHWLTREGMRVAGLEGAVVKPRLSHIIHDLTVVDVARYLTERRPEHELHTEREIRRVETPNQHQTEVEQRFTLTLPEATSRFSRIFPDLVSVAPDSTTWAHEVEATRKEHRRLVRLMLAYAAAPNITYARYYALPAVGSSVRRAAAEANRIATERGQGKPIMVTDWPITKQGEQ